MVAGYNSDVDKSARLNGDGGRMRCDRGRLIMGGGVRGGSIGNKDESGKQWRHTLVSNFHMSKIHVTLCRKRSKQQHNSGSRYNSRSGDSSGNNIVAAAMMKMTVVVGEDAALRVIEGAVAAMPGAEVNKEGF